jgi:hypothetical protein
MWLFEALDEVEFMESLNVNCLILAGGGGRGDFKIKISRNKDL